MRFRQLTKPSVSLILAVGLALRIYADAPSAAAKSAVLPAERKQYAIALDSNSPALRQDDVSSIPPDVPLEFAVVPRAESAEPPQPSVAEAFHASFWQQTAGVLDAILGIFTGNQPATTANPPVATTPKPRPVSAPSTARTLPVSNPPSSYQPSNPNPTPTRTIIAERPIGDFVSRTELDAIENSFAAQLAALRAECHTSSSGVSASGIMPATPYTSASAPAAVTSYIAPSAPIYTFSNFTTTNNTTSSGNTFDQATITNSHISGSAVGATTLSVSGLSSLATTSVSNLSVTGAGTSTFAGNVCANAFYGDGSHLSGIVAGSSYTDACARNALSSSATGLDYATSTGIFSFTSGYNIPLTASTTAWNNFTATPSSVITAGTNLSWSGNTLNVCGIPSYSASCVNALSPIVVGNGNAAIGSNASALGYCNVASGCFSSAVGHCNTASNYKSSAFGFRNTASGYVGSAFGFQSTASGRYSSAFGRADTASGNYSTAIGANSASHGSFSGAFGYLNNACCNTSYALGANITNSTANSVEIGAANTEKLQILAGCVNFSTASSTGGFYVNGVAVGGGSSFCTACLNTLNPVQVGWNNSATCATASAVGYCSSASNACASAFGYFNCATATSSTALGYCSVASGCDSTASGYKSIASNYFSSAFGSGNAACGCFSTAFGNGNTASVGGSTSVGSYNTASGYYSSAFGRSNNVSNYYSIAAGFSNSVTGYVGTGVGYGNNVCSAFGSAVGYANNICALYSSAMGFLNSVCNDSSADYCYLYAGGTCNVACGCCNSAVGFGNCTMALVCYATPGAMNAWGHSALGYCNVTGAGCLYGCGVHADMHGQTAVGFCNTISGYNTYLASAFGSCITNCTSNSVEIGPSDTYKLRIDSSGASLTAGSFYSISDKNQKQNFVALDKSAILGKINNLDIEQWAYKTDPSVSHIGPFAQDFYAAFHLGSSDKTVSLIDPAGVALVGVQALSQKLDALNASTTAEFSSTSAALAAVTGSMENFGLTSTSTPTSMAVSWITAALQSLGAKIEQGVATFVAVVADKLTAREIVVNDLKADSIETTKLCLEDVCVTKVELQTLLAKQGVQAAAAVADAVSTGAASSTSSASASSTATSTDIVTVTTTSTSAGSPSVTSSTTPVADSSAAATTTIAGTDSGTASTTVSSLDTTASGAPSASVTPDASSSSSQVSASASPVPAAAPQVSDSVTAPSAPAPAPTNSTSE